MERTARGVFVYLTDEQGRILCVHHSYGQERWSLPGGKVEKGESLYGAARRELHEETGLNLLKVKMIGLFTLLKTRGHVVLLRALCSDGSLATENMDGEIAERKWFTPEEIDSAEGDFYPAQFKLIKWALHCAPGDPPIKHPLTMPLTMPPVKALATDLS